MGSIFYNQKEEFSLEVKDLPQTTESTESDHVVSSISQKTRLISFKNIFEKISFSSLTTTAKNIVGAINELNAHKKMIYVHNGIIRNTGDASLAALLTRLINEGYYNGAMAAMSYPEFPTQAWTYVVRWNFSFDSLAFVEMYRLYDGNRLWNWLRITDGTWMSSTWYTT